MTHADRDRSEQPNVTTPDADRLTRYAEAISEATGIAAHRPQVQKEARAVMAVADAEKAELLAEVERLKSAAKTLGGIVHEQAQMALDATGRHDLIEADGDGDWQTVWELLAELRPRAEAAEALWADERAKVARVEALLGNWEATKSNPEAEAWTHYVAERVRNALNNDYRSETQAGDARP